MDRSGSYLSCACVSSLLILVPNLVPRVFLPYCAGLTKRATLESSVTNSILIGLKDNTNGRKQYSKKFVGHSFESWACATQPEVRYFRTSNRIFPGSLVSRPLIKRNEDPRYGGASSPELFVFLAHLWRACAMKELF